MAGVGGMVKPVNQPVTRIWVPWKGFMLPATERSAGGYLLLHLTTA